MAVRKLNKQSSALKILDNPPRPDEIKAFLDQYVVGQEEAKRRLSLAAYNHYKRLKYNTGRRKEGDVEIEKSNVLLLGETGSGKTLLVRTLARLLGVPCHIQDCTKITASGYVGSDVEDCIVGLLRATDYDVEAAEMGIVMLDEVDKIAKVGENRSITRDVSGECVQQSLLKIVEGDVVGVAPMGGRKHPEQSCTFVNTSNILFIASGAFSGMEYDVHVTPRDLQKYGMIPEFVGRFPVITTVEKLGEDDLLHILTEPRNALTAQYAKLIEMEGGKLRFEPEALREVAHLAHTLGTGARSLRNILETVMTDVMFDAPRLLSGILRKKTITVSRDLVREKCRHMFETSKSHSMIGFK